ncbi:MAG: S8/S53 family peptidase [Acidimicrobiia bacterium]
MAVDAVELHGSRYLPGLVACAADRVDEAVELIGGEVLGPGALIEMVDADLDEGVVEQILETVGVIGSVEDPVAASTVLIENGIRTSPIHALGTQNHLSAMPGTDPEPAKVQTPPVIAASSPNRIIGVIDTGVGEKLPEWLESGVHNASDRERVKSPSASHGTFVAGIIRRIAPEHTILVLRARRIPIDRFVIDIPAKGHRKGDDPTTELHVYEAIFRMVKILRKQRCDVAALNLSLGGAASGEGDPLMVMLEMAIDLWRNSFSREVPVFAAGGNLQIMSPIFPGAFGHVRAVAAATDGGIQVVWDPHSAATPNPPIPYSGRPWINEVAPGSELVSPSGVSPGEWVKWSGSSFATAVATGSYASRRPNEALGGMLWWPDRQTKASDIPGLVL